MCKISQFFQTLDVPLLLVLILFIILLFSAATAISHCMLAAKLEEIERLLLERLGCLTSGCQRDGKSFN